MRRVRRTRGRDVQPGPERSGPGHLVHLDGRLQALHRHGAEGLHLDVALRQPQRVRRQQGHPRPGQLFHPAGQMRSLTHSRVVHAKVGADGPDDHLAGVEPDPDLHVDPVGSTDLLGVPAQGGSACRGRRSSARTA